MIFAVPDEDSAIAINKDSVRTRQLALQRLAVRPVSALSRAHDKFNRSLFPINHADAVTFGVREINVPIRRDADALRAGQRRPFRRSAIAGVA